MFHAHLQTIPYRFDPAPGFYLVSFETFQKTGFEIHNIFFADIYDQ